MRLHHIPKIGAVYKFDDHFAIFGALPKSRNRDRRTRHDHCSHALPGKPSTHLTGAPQIFPKPPDRKHRNDFKLFYFEIWVLPAVLVAK